ncbi:MAG: putative glycoside hydrolase [Candidatus Harrisonbacteria bacterium]|nr:putative glycoside hydrolase [Candidatus Harrisonbacteria bacterium]
MRNTIIFLIFLLAGGGLFLFFKAHNDFQLAQISEVTHEMEANKLVIENKAKQDAIAANPDLPLQKPLENPPEVIKALYATGWSAGSVKKMNYLMDLLKKTELNAIVIDVKDYTGQVSYDTDIELINKYGAEEIRIQRPNALIKKLHDEGIYAIARLAVFQDPILAKNRPDLAVTSTSTGKQWKDYKGIMWIDPAAKEAWDYNIEIAKDALARGFDEINFDYIRFPSDGNLNDARFPFWDGVTLKRHVIRDFWKYLRKALPEAKISADLFGLVTVNYGDVGIGQNIDDAYNYFDAVAPMVYPSHYNVGFDGYQNPAAHPYEVVHNSILVASERLKQYIINAENSTSTEKYLVKKPQLRPWLQDFDLGANYDAEKVRAQIKATYDAASSTPIGWMLWNPANNYTKAALLPE